ncbi:MAG: hypothetical protein HEQ19_12755 [Gloeotrichia echinulata CP02]|jgi:hypothetical protein
MTAVKKGIALIMLTLVMLLGSVAQGLTASADEIVIGANEVNRCVYFNVIPFQRYSWYLRNASPTQSNRISIANVVPNPTTGTASPAGTTGGIFTATTVQQPYFTATQQGIFRWDLLPGRK